MICITNLLYRIVICVACCVFDVAGISVKNVRGFRPGRRQWYGLRYRLYMWAGNLLHESKYRPLPIKQRLALAPARALNSTDLCRKGKLLSSGHGFGSLADKVRRRNAPEVNLLLTLIPLALVFVVSLLLVRPCGPDVSAGVFMLGFCLLCCLRPRVVGGGL